LLLLPMFLCLSTSQLCLLQLTEASDSVLKHEPSSAEDFQEIFVLMNSLVQNIKKNRMSEK